MYNYHYDGKHPLKPFTGKGFANKGSLPPKNATRIEPPEAGPGQWPVYAGGSWGLAEDHRDEKGYINGVPAEIKDIGPYPEGWSETPPPLTAEQVREAAISECLAKLGELDAKSTRSIRAIEVMKNSGGYTEELVAELAFLAGLEEQAVAERAKLADLREAAQNAAN